VHIKYGLCGVFVNAWPVSNGLGVKRPSGYWPSVLILASGLTSPVSAS